MVSLRAADRRQEEARKSLDDASQHLRVTYLPFLLVLVYVLLAVAATTDRDLLIGKSQPLPLIDIEVPVARFYVVAPFLVAVLQINLLMQLDLLARKARLFSETVANDGDADDQKTLVYPVLASHALVPPLRVLSLPWLFTIVIGSVAPVIVLLFVQLRFLPYHSAGITWFHRILILVSLLGSWLLWTSVIANVRRLALLFVECLRRWRISIVTLAMLAGLAVQGAVLILLVALAALISFGFRTARRDWPWPVMLRMSMGALVAARGSSLYVSLREVVASCRVLLAVAVAASLLVIAVSQILFAIPGEVPDRMVLSWLGAGGLVPRDLNVSGQRLSAVDIPPDIEVALLDRPESEEDWLRHAKPLDLRGRDLRGADFSGADLIKPHFDGANLDGADFTGATLRHAKIQCRLEGVIFDMANLDRAVLNTTTALDCGFRETKLRGASLVSVAFWRVDISRAQLQGADLRKATFEGLNADRARFSAALLHDVRMRHARLTNASFVGADLSRADLADANLRSARLQGALLWRANLKRAAVATTRVPKERSPEARSVVVVEDADFREVDGLSPAQRAAMGQAGARISDLPATEQQEAAYYRSLAARLHVLALESEWTALGLTKQARASARLWPTGVEYQPGLGGRPGLRRRADAVGWALIAPESIHESNVSGALDDVTDDDLRLLEALAEEHLRASGHEVDRQ